LDELGYAWMSWAAGADGENQLLTLLFDAVDADAEDCMAGC